MTIGREPIIMAQISDTHLLHRPALALRGADPDAGLRAVIHDIKNQPRKVDLVVHTGDLIQTNGHIKEITSAGLQDYEAPPDDEERTRIARSYDRLRKHLAQLGKPVYCMPGNHDPADEFETAMKGGVFQRTRRLVQGPWQIIMLDSSVAGSPAGGLARSELHFLSETLASHDQPAVVFMHHAPVSINSEWLDTMIVKNADELLSIVDGFPQLRGIVFGHIHQGFERMRGNAVMLGAPSTSLQFKPGGTEPVVDRIRPGYRLLELHPDGRIQSKVVRVNTSERIYYEL